MSTEREEESRACRPSPLDLFENAIFLSEEPNDSADSTILIVKVGDAVLRLNVQATRKLGPIATGQRVSVLIDPEGIARIVPIRSKPSKKEE